MRWSPPKLVYGPGTATTSKRRGRPSRRWCRPTARRWAERGGFIASNLEVDDDAYDVEIMLELSEMADEVELVPDLDDTLGDPFQSEFWSVLTGFWAEPDQDVEPLVDSLDAVLQETVEEQDEV